MTLHEKPVQNIAQSRQIELTFRILDHRIKDRLHRMFDTLKSLLGECAMCAAELLSISVKRKFSVWRLMCPSAATSGSFPRKTLP